MLWSPCGTSATCCLPLVPSLSPARQPGAHCNASASAEFSPTSIARRCCSASECPPPPPRVQDLLHHGRASPGRPTCWQSTLTRAVIFFSALTTGGQRSAPLALRPACISIMWKLMAHLACSARWPPAVLFQPALYGAAARAQRPECCVQAYDSGPLSGSTPWRFCVAPKWQSVGWQKPGTTRP